jgi:hypothetical protein
VVAAIILLLPATGHVVRNGLREGGLPPARAPGAALLCEPEEFLYRRDDARIELRARTAAKLLEGLPLRQPWSVGTLDDHRVVGAGDGHHARRQGDLLAGQTSRVPGAVEALVMRGDGACHFGRAAKLPQQALPRERMLTDEGPPR